MRLRENVIALGDTAAGGLLWRVGGRLHLSVVVKASFDFVQAERMTPHAAPPLHDADVLLASGEGVIAPSDLVPYLGKADVMVCGGAEDAGKPVRLVLRRESGTVLDKLAPLAELGAIKSADSRRFGRLWKGMVATDVPDLPVEMDWTLFQAAPADQQVSYLTGDEWLLLRDLTPGGLLRSQLPGAMGAIWVAPRGGGMETGYPVTTIADRLLVDGAAETVTITWRGAIPLESVEMLAQLQIAAGVHLPGKPVVWDDAPKAEFLNDSVVLSITPEGLLSLEDTITEVKASQLAPTAAMPAMPGMPAMNTVFLDEPLDTDDDEDDDAMEGTIAIAQETADGDEDDDDDAMDGTIGIAQLVAPEVVSPFPLQQPGARPALGHVAIPGAPWAVEKNEDPMDSTVGIAQFVPEPATPFAGKAAPPPNALDITDLAGATADMTRAQALAAWGQAGLPFEADEPASEEPVSPWAGGPTKRQKPRAKAQSLNSKIRAELGILPGPEPSPAAPISAPVAAPASAPASAPVSSSPPKPPERVDGAAAAPPSSEQVETKTPEVDPASAPAPPAGATHGEEFLAAVAWLSDNKNE